MSKLSRKFKVPDGLADLFDFANTLDVRHFVHHGVRHPRSDELATPQQLGAWLSEHGLAAADAKITPALLETALTLRGAVRAYLQCDPAQRRRNRDVTGTLNAALQPFLLTVEVGTGGGTLVAARNDPLSGLSAVVRELYDGSLNGSLDRLKMCASEECRRVFFDRSKPATRRWCMSTLCGNRMKTRAWRERQREGA